MYTVTVKVEAKGEKDDFECNAQVQYLHVASKDDVNKIQQAVTTGLFGLGKASAK